MRRTDGNSSYSDKCCERFYCRKGSDNKYGARPLRRAIQSKIEDALANEILEGRVKRGDSVQVKLHKNEIAFEVKKQ